MVILNNVYKLVLQAANFGLFHFGKTEPIVGPFKILWFLNYKCNARCRFCNRWKEKSDRLEVDTATVKNALNDLAKKGSYALSLSGGEPLLRKDIFEIIKHAKSKGFGLINLDTNALLLERYAEKLIDTGLDTIYVSLDSPIAEKHDWFRGVNGCYDKAINIKPNDAEAWLDKGMVWWPLGKYDDARICLKKAIQIDPNGDAGIRAGDILKLLP